MEKEYSKLKEKFNLPTYAQLAKDFDIENIDEDENILKEIIKKVYSKFESYASLFESLLQPDGNLSTMHEASHLSKEQIDLVKILFRRLMLMQRKINENVLEYDENVFAENIKKSYELWQELKPEIKVILSALKESWTKDTVIKEDRGYFG